MLTWTRAQRLIGIQRVLVKYSLDDLIHASPALKPLRLVFMLGGRLAHQYVISNNPEAICRKVSAGI